MVLPLVAIFVLNVHGFFPSIEEELSGCSLCNMTNFCDFGDCCDVDDDSYRKWSDGTASHRFSCIATKFLIDPLPTNFKYPVDVMEGTYLQNAWMISACPSGETNETLKNFCENPEVWDIIESVVPVSDSVLHFRNKFCAYCNGINESSLLTSWDTELYCDADLSSSTNILAAVIRRKCNFFFRPPQNIPVEECQIRKGWITDYVADTTCNLTFYKSVNSTVSIDRTTCELDPNPKHYLCYVCDKDHRNVNMTGRFCIRYVHDIYPPVSPPFFAILDIATVISAKPKETPGDHCDIALQFYDINKMICRELSCFDDRYLLDGQCVMKRKKEPDSGCLTFLFFIKLIPVTANNKTYLAEDELDLEHLPNTLYRFIREVVVKADPLINISESVIEDFRVYKKVSINTGGNYAVEHFIVQLAVNTPNYTIDFLSYMYTQFHEVSFSFHETEFTSEFDLYDIIGTYNDENWIWHFDPRIHVPSLPNTTDHILEQIPFSNTLYEVGSVNYCYILFRKITVCSYFKLELNEFSTKIENRFLILEDNETSARFSPWEFETEKEIHICESDYKRYFNSHSTTIYPKQKPVQQTTPIEAKQFFSFFLVCLSIFCLLITIATYMRFPVLHSQPGINNIILCTCLFLAQTLYQFGAAQTSLPDWACSLIGAICHFLWLAVMFSMNVCSVEMYLVFRSLTKLPSKFSRWRTTRNLLYIVLSSFLFVLINIIVSLFLSGGQHIGYGGIICYLSSQTLQLLTFALPAAAVVIANILLFFIVIFKINKFCIDSANLNQERNYLAIYARLSSLTGLTWVFGFLQLLLNQEVLEYIFIILNAGQGVIILLAFVCNKKVLSLCKRRDHSLSECSR